MAGPVTTRSLYKTISGAEATSQQPVGLIFKDLESVFYETGKERPPEFPTVFNVTTMQTNPEKHFQVAGLGTQPVKLENDPFAVDRHILGGEKLYSAVSYGLAVEFSFESWRDELYGVLKEMVAELARANRNRQEVQAWSVLNNAFSTSFVGFTAGEALCQAHTGLDGATRRNRPTVDVGMSIALVQGVIQRYESMTTERGLPRLMSPTMAVVTPTNKFKTREILGSSGKPFSADNEMNSLLQDDLSWMVGHYITTAAYNFFLAAKGTHTLDFKWRTKPIFDSYDDPRTKAAVFTSFQSLTSGFRSWRGVDGSTA